MEIALLLWGLIVGFSAGGKLATDHKITIRAAKLPPLKISYLRPCIGAHDVECDR